LSLDSAGLQSRYEQLRAAALGPGAAGQGWALLRHRGMAAWMLAWARCAPPPSPSPAAAGLDREPSLASPEIVRVLTAMAVAALGG
jgi:hypothetical protein